MPDNDWMGKHNRLNYGTSILNVCIMHDICFKCLDRSIFLMENVHYLYHRHEQLDFCVII